MNTDRSGLLDSVLRSISQLPERVQGKGSRADHFTTWGGADIKFAVLNDGEFNTVVEHNTKGRVSGEEANAIYISNGDDGKFLIIRGSVLWRNSSLGTWTPTHTTKLNNPEQMESVIILLEKELRNAEMAFIDNSIAQLNAKRDSPVPETSHHLERIIALRKAISLLTAHADE